MEAPEGVVRPFYELGGVVEFDVAAGPTVLDPSKCLAQGR